MNEKYSYQTKNGVIYKQYGGLKSFQNLSHLKIKFLLRNFFPTQKLIKSKNR